MDSVRRAPHVARTAGLRNKGPVCPGWSFPLAAALIDLKGAAPRGRHLGVRTFDTLTGWIERVSRFVRK